MGSLIFLHFQSANRQGAATNMAVAVLRKKNREHSCRSAYRAHVICLWQKPMFIPNPLFNIKEKVRVDLKRNYGGDC
jgi:hypothetical protein